MAVRKSRLDLFREFFHSEKAAGFILIGCTIVTILLCNLGPGEEIVHFIHSYVDLSFAGLSLNYSVEHWVNDGLMAIFFLLIGLEIERELYVGELRKFKFAVLPVMAAFGGMLFPALIHLALNSGTPFQPGFGIPMATDIAFALGILSLAGNRVPLSLKVFLTALAIIDDLGAITVIAIFYTSDFSFAYFASSMGVFGLLFLLGKLRVHYLSIYLLGGVIMWFLMLKSGVHATIAGVLLAFAIPFHKDDRLNPSLKLQHALHKIVAFLILPIFAIVNTAIIIPANAIQGLANTNSLGIIIGLIVGKVTGILVFCYLGIKSTITQMSVGLNWRLLFGVSLLAGIGFTMSIFISNLAFPGDYDTITNSKISILVASLIAGTSGLIVLRTGAAYILQEDVTKD